MAETLHGMVEPDSALWLRYDTEAEAEAAAADLTRDTGRVFVVLTVRVHERPDPFEL